MLIAAEGTIVGRHAETWEGRNGKQGGSRLTVWLQQHPGGESAPLEIDVQAEHRASFADLAFGVKCKVMVDAQAYGRVQSGATGTYATGEFRCKTVGNAERLQKAA